MNSGVLNTLVEQDGLLPLFGWSRRTEPVVARMLPSQRSGEDSGPSLDARPMKFDFTQLPLQNRLKLISLTVHDKLHKLGV